jgi:hypothetical protein
MVDLFIVSNPFQVISAIEAKEFFKSKESILIVLLQKENSLNLQVEESIAFSSWNEILYMKPVKSKFRFLYYVKFIREFLKREHNFRYIFLKDIVGSPAGHFQKVLAVNLPHQKIFSLDDGVKTISDYGKVEIEKFSKVWKWKLFGLKTELEIYSLFTAFDLPKSDLEVVRHNFSFFKNYILKYKFETKTENLYFIGSPLIKAKFVNSETYKKMLLDVKRDFREKRQFYIPHRYCDEQSLEIAKECGFEILKFTKPIELEFLERREVPVNIISNISTATISLKLIFDIEKPILYKFQSRDINLEKLEIVKNLYTQFQKYGIELHT